MASCDCFLSHKNNKNKLKDKRLDEGETIKYTAMQQLLQFQKLSLIRVPSTLRNNGTNV
jgi:hypothetical protein